ncbi:hypothetical protein AAC387_Pa01g2419 [Persea americana]
MNQQARRHSSSSDSSTACTARVMTAATPGISPSFAPSAESSPLCYSFPPLREPQLQLLLSLSVRLPQQPSHLNSSIVPSSRRALRSSNPEGNTISVGVTRGTTDISTSSRGPRQQGRSLRSPMRKPRPQGMWSEVHFSFVISMLKYYLTPVRCIPMYLQSLH